MPNSMSPALICGSLVPVKMPACFVLESSLSEKLNAPITKRPVGLCLIEAEPAQGDVVDRGCGQAPAHLTPSLVVEIHVAVADVQETEARIVTGIELVHQ